MIAAAGMNYCFRWLVSEVKTDSSLTRFVFFCDVYSLPSNAIFAAELAAASLTTLVWGAWICWFFLLWLLLSFCTVRSLNILSLNRLSWFMSRILPLHLQLGPLHLRYHTFLGNSSGRSDKTFVFLIDSLWKSGIFMLLKLILCFLKFFFLIPNIGKQF